MVTKEEIDEEYRREHEILTKRYYVDHEITKEEFERLHQELYKNYLLKRCKILNEIEAHVALWHGKYRYRFIKNLVSYFEEKSINKTEFDKEMADIFKESANEVVALGLLDKKKVKDARELYYALLQEITDAWDKYWRKIITGTEWNSICQQAWGDFLSNLTTKVFKRE